MQNFGGTNKEYYGVFDSSLLRESLMAGVYFSQTSVTFAGDLAAVRIKWRDVRNSEVSARRELTVSVKRQTRTSETTIIYTLLIAIIINIRGQIANCPHQSI